MILIKLAKPHTSHRRDVVKDIDQRTNKFRVSSRLLCLRASLKFITRITLTGFQCFHIGANKLTHTAKYHDERHYRACVDVRLLEVLVVSGRLSAAVSQHLCGNLVGEFRPSYSQTCFSITPLPQKFPLPLRPSTSPKFSSLSLICARFRLQEISPTSPETRKLNFLNS